MVPLSTAIQFAIEIIRAKVATLQAVYLFGSYSDGKARLDSDIDFAFLNDARQLDAVALWNLEQEIAVAINSDVHLIDIRHASDVLRSEILSKGRVIFDLDPDGRREFEVYALCSYADFNEFRREFLEEFYK